MVFGRAYDDKCLPLQGRLCALGPKRMLKLWQATPLYREPEVIGVRLGAPQGLTANIAASPLGPGVEGEPTTPLRNALRR